LKQLFKDDGEKPNSDEKKKSKPKVTRIISSPSGDALVTVDEEDWAEFNDHY